MAEPFTDSPAVDIVDSDAFLASLSQEDAKIARITSHVLHRQVMHMGPLPPPEMLAGYEQILPGSAERILSMAEKQQEHRHSIEKTIVSANVRDQRLGILFAFLLGMSGIGCGTVTILLGHTLEGFSAYLATLASLVGVFVYGRREQRKEREAAQASEEN